MSSTQEEHNTHDTPAPSDGDTQQRNSKRRFNNRRDRNQRRERSDVKDADSPLPSELESATDDKPQKPQRDQRRNNRNEQRNSDNRNEQRNNENRNEQRIEQRANENRQRHHERGNRHQSDTPSISVVIPMLNEDESLPELIQRLEQELEPLARGRYEVLFIDDGSTDTSFEVVRNANRRNNRIKGIRFRRNYGKSAALSVGFAAAKHDVVITMDADLQDDPAELTNLVAKINEGYDLVSGWKKKRHDPLEKRLPSKFFNAVTSFVSGIKLHDFNCGLKAYRRDVVKTVQVYGEMHRYIPALAHWEGFRITELPVQHHARKYGQSKFGFSRYMKGFLDLLTVVFTTRFIKRPLHLFGTVGALFALIGFGIDLTLSIEWAMNQTSLSNRPLLFMGIAMIIVGVQLVSMGLLGEMIVKNSLTNAEYTIRERV